MSKKTRKERRVTWVRALAIVLAVLLIGTVVASVLPLFGLAEGVGDRNDYSITLVPDLTGQILAMDETLTYVNNTSRTLEAVWFNVYANTLRRTATVPVEYSQWSSAFPAGYAPGGVSFFSVSVNGSPANWAVSGQAEQHLYVPCHLAPGEKAEIRFQGLLRLPPGALFCGSGDALWRLNDFYPIAAVYDDSTEDFTLNPFTACTDPLLSDAADYHVSVTVPEGWSLASTGAAEAVSTENGYTTWQIEAEGVRDMALVFGKDLSSAEGATETGTSVRALANSASQARAMLDAALDALNVMEGWFGPAGLPEIEIVGLDMASGGLSKPGLLEIDASLLKDRDAMVRQIAFLCAGQWFGCLVGSDPENEPWLKETLCAYTARLYDEEKNGYAHYIRRLNQEVLPAIQMTVPGGLKIDSAASRFTSSEDFDLVVRERGCAVFHELRSSMGRDALIEALAQYIRNNAGKIATIEQLAAGLDEASGQRWDEFLAYELQNAGNYGAAEYPRFE